MLRITQNSVAAGAKSYYSSSDYYKDGQESAGVWRGQGAQRLGLSGEIEKRDWEALCDNRDPSTGDKLTPRQKSNRRVGYDFNFHAPKSVSLLFGLTGDERLLTAFRDAVDTTMNDMEAEMHTRVRSGGRDEDRATGNMLWGEFIHTTARPVGGLPDPHLHAHCFVFNQTWDAKEERWKAGQFAQIKESAPYFEALFHSRLAHNLEQQGLPVERTRTGWEIQGLERSTLARFSRRTAMIEERARRDGIVDAKEKSELGAKTRERKQKSLTLTELRNSWRDRLSDGERDAMARVMSRLGSSPVAREGGAVRDAVIAAEDHCFERSAAVRERTLLAEALRRAVGVGTPEEVKQAIAVRGLLTATRDGERWVTTRAVLAEEREMVDFARRGRGALAPLAPRRELSRDWLSKDQCRAVEQVWRSFDRVIVVRGAAGVGKTAMMKEAVEGIEAAGKRVLPLAPSAAAAFAVLRDEEGFASAQTVARFLVDTQVQERARGQVLWIDEAGLLGSRAMARVFQIAERIDARVVLSGDRRQHGSVERGAALRLLETEAGVVPVEIREIRRQRGDYKEAIKALSEGKTDAGFRQLDRLGWIREVGDGSRYDAIANEYVSSVRGGNSTLVVSPTHREGEVITGAIREALKRAGTIRGGEAVVPILRNRNLTESDRRDARSYGGKEVLVFHQNAQGYKKGEQVDAAKERMPYDQAQRFQVFDRDHLGLASGDLVRITRGGKTSDGKHRLDTGAVYQLRGFDKSGDLVLANGWRVSREFGHLDYGYVATSHASQGRSVDHVILGQSAGDSLASSREQFYVSASRGKQKATIFTDNKVGLLAAVSKSDERLAASDLFKAADVRARAFTVQRLAALDDRTRSHESKHPSREIEHVR